METINDSEKEQFDDVCKKTHKNQAVFFLNAFWPELSGEANNIFKFWQQTIVLDKQMWNALPEGKRAETYAETKDLDEFWSHKLLEMNGLTMTVIEFRNEFKKIDINFDKRMGMAEFLLYKYQQSVKVLLSRPQGTNELLVKAQKALDDVSAEISRIETEKSTLEKLAEGEGVKARTAKASLAALLSADQTELNKKLMTAEAAVRKARKAPGDSPQGQLWWLEREIEEAKKYKPKAAK